jgi:hypothetical protein
MEENNGMNMSKRIAYPVLHALKGSVVGFLLVMYFF